MNDIMDDSVSLDLKVVIKTDDDVFIVNVTVPSAHIDVEARDESLREAIISACIKCSNELRAQDWDTTPEQVGDVVLQAIENADVVINN